MSRVQPPRVIQSCLPLFLSLCVSATTAIAQDNRPVVQLGDDVYLSLHNDQDRYVIEPESSSNWPCMRRGPGQEKVVLKVHGSKGDNGDIRHGSLVSIQTSVTTHRDPLPYDRLYMSQNSWVYCDTFKERGEANEQWWTIERTAGDGTVRDGDHVTFRNRYWPDRFINIEEHGKWLTCSTTASAFTITLKNKPNAPKEDLNKRDSKDYTYVVMYGRNPNRASISGSRKMWSLEESQQVQVGEERSSNWGTEVMIGFEGGSDKAKFKSEVKYMQEQAMAHVREAVNAKTLSTSVELTFDVPSCEAIFHIFKIRIPYTVWDIPGSVKEANSKSLQLRQFNGVLEQVKHEIVTIPSRDDDGNIIPVEYAEVDRALTLYAMNASERTQANELRRKIPGWQKSGWVTVPTALKSGQQVLISNKAETRYLVRPVDFKGAVSSQLGELSMAVPHTIRSANDDGKPLSHGDIVSLETTATTKAEHIRINVQRFEDNFSNVFGRPFHSHTYRICYDKAQSTTAAPEQWWTLEKAEGGTGVIYEHEPVVLHNTKWTGSYLFVTDDIGGRVPSPGAHSALRVTLAAKPGTENPGDAQTSATSEDESDPRRKLKPRATARPKP